MNVVALMIRGYCYGVGFPWRKKMVRSEERGCKTTADGRYRIDTGTVFSITRSSKHATYPLLLIMCSIAILMLLLSISYVSKLRINF